MLKSCKDQALADVTQLEGKMRERLEWSAVKLLRAILVFLDTQTWRPVIAAVGQSDSESEGSPEDKSLLEVIAAVEIIATTFQEPLEAIGISLVLQDEITVVVERNYLSIEREEYHKVCTSWPRSQALPPHDDAKLLNCSLSSWGESLGMRLDTSCTFAQMPTGG